MSKAKAFKLALYNALSGLYTTPTIVTYGHHGTASSTELVMVRDMSAEEAVGPLSTNRKREETIDVTVVFYVGSGDTNQRTVTERCYDLFGDMQEYLQDAGVTASSQITLGGSVIDTRVTAHTLEETDDPDDLAAGRFARITATVTARARY